VLVEAPCTKDMITFCDDGDTDAHGDVDVVEKVLHRHLCHHSRRPTRSNHRSFYRVFIATVSAATVVFCCCRDDSQLVGTVVCRCVP